MAVLRQLMYDRVHAELTAQDSVRDWTFQLADLYARHHWLADVSWSRPVSGPHEQAALERLVTLLAGIEPGRGHRATVVSLLFGQARATGRLIADARFAPVASGVDDDRWWQERSVAMAELVPDFAERFPFSATLGSVPELRWPAPQAPDAGYLERQAWAGLSAAVDLVLGT